MVVVAAAGNFGKNLDDEIQYGGITAPGNAPWVLTVGAYSHMGTPDPRRRSRRRLQLSWAHGLRLRRQARPGRARHAHRVAQRRRQLSGTAQP